MENDNDISLDPTYAGNIWSTKGVSGTEWRIYLTDLDDDPRNHIRAIDLIRSADPSDTLDIFITSSGGAVDLADMYVTAMKAASATITTHAVGMCASAATTIFLHGDVRVCEEGSSFMFHNVQFGDGRADSANVYISSRFFERLYKEKYYPLLQEVLSASELGELFERAGEVYLTGSEVSSRLKKDKRTDITDSDWDGTKDIRLDFGRCGLAIRNGATKGSDPFATALRKEVNDLTTAAMEEPLMTPEEWMKNVQEYRPPKVVTMPFPKTEVKSAVEFPNEDDFDITLDEGYKKTFRLSTLRPSDFDEYNRQEIQEIGHCFDVWLSDLTRDQALDLLISHLQKGAGN